MAEWRFPRTSPWSVLVCLLWGVLCVHFALCFRPSRNNDAPNRGDQAGGNKNAGKRCASGWVHLHRACYLFVTQPPSGWADAVRDCRRETGQLLSISSMVEMKNIQKELKKRDSRKTWWIGLNKNNTKWEWLDGGDFNYRITRWMTGEPNNAGKEECAEMNAEGQINDKECSSLRPFICERRTVIPRPRHFTSPLIPIPVTMTNATITTTTTTSISVTTATTTTTARPATGATSKAATLFISNTTTTLTLSSAKNDSVTANDDVQAVTSMTSRPVTPTTASSSSSSPPSSTSVLSTSTGNEDEEEGEEDENEDPFGGVDGNERGTTGDETENKGGNVTTTTTDGDGDGDDDDEGNQRGGKRPEGKRNRNRGGNDNDDDEDDNDEVDLFELYSGCFMVEGPRRRKDRQRSFLYTVGSTTCPAVVASGVTWPETRHGVVQTRPCRRRNGTMTFTCGGEPTCWRGVPNVDQCASPAFRNLLRRFSSDDDKREPPEPEETLAVTSELANVTKGDDVTEEDIVVTSKLISGLASSGAARKIKDRKAVKNVVANVIRAGSNLVSTDKTTSLWTRMNRRQKIRSATSLLVAMETATTAMAEELKEPTTIVTRDNNIELELRVVKVSPSADASENIVYNAEDSDTQFSIPLQTLGQLSSGGLAKMVFMTHYTMGNILDDTTDDNADDNLLESADDKAEDKVDDNETSPKLASYVISATVASNENSVNLPQPVTFTITHTRNIPEGFQPLCSFWSIGDSGLGAWSQEGCSLVDSNSTHTKCACDHMTNFAVLMAVREVEISDVHKALLRAVTIVGCVISCLCLIASWVTFTCFSSLQGERNSIHKNLAVCLFVAEMLFLTGIDQTENRVACGIVAALLHYFFLAAFLWMMMEGVHIILMLVQVFDASRSRLPYYYAGAYGPPVLIIAISAGVYADGYGTDEYCWLTTERSFIWSFAGPVAVILFVNSVILIYAMTMVCRHSDYVFSNKDKSAAGNVRSWIQGAMALEVLLGLTWIIGFFFLTEQSVAVAYIFTILNSTQGLFIFIFHCLLNKKARKEYRRVMRLTSLASSTGTGSGTHTASLAKNKLTSGQSFNRNSPSREDNVASKEDSTPTHK